MTADKDFYDTLLKLQKSHKDNGNEEFTLAEVVEESVFFLNQINTLLTNGYKIAIVDPKGKKHTISKKRRKDKDEPGTNEGSGREGFEG